MTRTVIQTADRTGTYKDVSGSFGTFVQWSDPNTAANAVKLAFVTAWNFSPSMDEWDIDRIDTAAPIFTKVNDILGAFSFNLKNVTSLYSTTNPSVDPLLLSTWIKLIGLGTPPTITFAPVMRRALDAGTNPYINLIFSGRVMSVPIDQVLDQGVQDVTISGDITTITQIQRSATVNEEGSP